MSGQTADQQAKVEGVGNDEQSSGASSTSGCDDGSSTVAVGDQTPAMDTDATQNLAVSSSTSEEPNFQLDCPICLQPAVHPVELPCSHIFCFLCIKGVAMQGPNGRCAICRSTIPHYVLTNPRLKDISQLYKDPKSCGYQWFYESRGGGWWQYDERTMQELERAYESSQPSCQLLIAGHLYEIDFSQMIQYRANNRNLIRRIKRDLPTAEKRGIAGIRLNGGPGDGSGSNSNPPVNGRRRRGASYPGVTAPSTANTAANGVHSSTTANTGGNNISYNPLGGVNGTNLPFRGPVHFDADPSDSEDQGEEDSEDSDLLDDEVEDDMELGEEEEALIGENSDDDEETEDDDDDETRDGARAPTRRSDRSTSSSNQTPPPPTPTVNGNGGSATHSNIHSSGGRTRGGRNSRGRTGSSNSGRNPSDCTSPLSEPVSPITPITARSIQISPISGTVPSINNNQGSLNSTTTTGLTCILIGPGVRITVDRENANGDEIL